MLELQGILEDRSLCLFSLDRWRTLSLESKDATEAVSDPVRDSSAARLLL